MRKLVRITTVPQSLELLLKGQLEYMSDYFKVIAISSEGKYLHNLNNKDNIDTYCVNMTRRITPLRDIAAIIKLVFILIKEKPQIVHTHTPKAGFVGMIAAKIVGVQVRMHTVAGLPLTETKGFKRFVLVTVEKLISSLAHYIFPNSFVLRNIMIENNLAPIHKLKVIGNGSTNGINLDYFKLDNTIRNKAQELKNELNILDTDLVLLYVGRIVKHKGINELIVSFLQLEKEYKNVKLLLVGSFDKSVNDISTKALIAIESSPHIFFYGFKNDIRPFLELSDIFVFPSYREGFPQVVLQALSWNLPCVVTDINGCNELIKDNVNGKLIPVKDSHKLYEALKILIDNEEYRKRLAKNSRVNIEKLYSNKIIWSELLSTYLNALDKLNG